MTLLEAFSVFAMIVFSSYIILVLLSISYEVPYTISLLVLSHEYHEYTLRPSSNSNQHIELIRALHQGDSIVLVGHPDG